MRTKFLATSCVMLLVFATASWAQKPSLDQVEAAIRKGDAQQARSILGRWEKATPNARDARAAFLSAKLMTDAEEAETAYLQVAISFPTSAYAAESLFRLGQARAAAGDAKQAKIYFKRVVTDFPKSEFATLANKHLR